MLKHSKCLLVVSIHWIKAWKSLHVVIAARCLSCSHVHRRLDTNSDFHWSKIKSLSMLSNKKAGTSSVCSGAGKNWFWFWWHVMKPKREKRSSKYIATGVCFVLIGLINTILLDCVKPFHIFVRISDRTSIEFICFRCSSRSASTMQLDRTRACWMWHTDCDYIKLFIDMPVC